MGALCTLSKWITKCLAAAHEALTWTIFCNGRALRQQADTSGETKHLTTPAHSLSIAVFVGWLLKGGVVKVHYALCSVKRCSSKQKRTAKIGKIKDPAWDAFQFSGFGLNGVRKLSLLTCSHSVWYKVNLYFHMEISEKKKKTNGSSRTTPFFLLIPRCGSKQDLEMCYN